MSPAVRRALAYAHVTGRLPSGLHVMTRMLAGNHLDFVPYQYAGMTLHRYQVKPEDLPLVARDPLYVACEWFRSHGFVLDAGRLCKTSHYLPYVHPRYQVEGIAYRGGGGGVTLLHDSVPYRTGLDLAEAGKAWPAIIRPAMYVGERLPGELGRTYAERAIAAYLAA